MTLELNHFPLHYHDKWLLHHNFMLVRASPEGIYILQCYFLFHICRGGNVHSLLVPRAYVDYVSLKFEFIYVSFGKFCTTFVLF